MENKIAQTIALLEKVTGKKVVLEAKAPNADALHKAKDKQIASEKKAKEATADALHKAKEKADAKKEKEVKKESIVTEAKDEKETPKKEKETSAPSKSSEAPLAAAATQNADEPILGNIIPTSVIKQIDAYVSDTLAEIDKSTTQLRAIKRQIASGATATGEDFSTLTERIAFLVKQLSRIALYSSNTIKAGKFDKKLLDLLFSQKELNTSIENNGIGSL